MENWSHYSEHLKRVSRSFAFCIERLHPPFRNWVGLAYILCRLVDTVEDSIWPSPDLQKESYKEFEDFILSLPKESAVGLWFSKFPANIPSGEIELLKDSFRFFTDLHLLPEVAKTPIKRTVLDMCHGMAHFSTNSNKGVRLANLIEANQYCFFVAGIIGEMLTELFAASQADYKITAENLVNSYRFGLFLQKINLLKDQIGDMPEGRYLVPNRDEMRQSLLQDAQGAINYILDIPIARKDYRIFCAWSLFLGLGSLPYIDQTWRDQKLTKIPRTKTLLLLGKVELQINNNEKLRKMYNEMLMKNFSDLTYNFETNTKTQDQIWIYKYYQGNLTPAQMSQLNLI